LPVVKGEPSQLCQLLQNLLVNAVKFRRQDVTPEVHVSATRQGKSWLLAVHDNGIGIPPEQHERIFVIFQRLHSRQKYNGTGIGLAVCQRIVEFHGGRIWVESEPGKGSTFLFNLPA
jgi:light-regulated signal transduction histidine kinase (bacteriophytochrome)